MSTNECTTTAPVQSRRRFCTDACRAASLLALAPLASACGGDSGTSPSSGNAPALATVAGTLSGGQVSVTLAGTALASNGAAALVQAGGRNYLVYRSGDQAFSVLTAVCTHESCTVSGFQNNQFVCPCHNSAFTTSGSVARGPATRSLTSYASSVNNGVLTFTA